MTRFDPSQQRVLELDPARHARVLGAPGSGKSLLLVESFARVSALPGYSDEQLLVLAPDRLAAAALRGALERRLDRVIGGTPVRTAASLAFAVLARESAASGEATPRLLTGTVHDEAIARVVEHGFTTPVLAPEVLASERFRSELRELWRVLDDFDLSPERAAALLREADERSRRETHAPRLDASMLERWIAAIDLTAVVGDELRRERPDELSSSELLRTAARLLREAPDHVAAVPRLILVDDAGQLGEGELAMLAACAQRGSRIWVFGDPDIAAGAFHGERAAVLSRLSDELARRGAGAGAMVGENEVEQSVVLERVHRHGVELRGFIRSLTARIGAAGAGQQRAAQAARVEKPDEAVRAAPRAAVQFARVGSPSEQLGALAHRLRARRLGLDGHEPLPWSQMAVICRSRDEVVRVARLLAERQIAVGVAAGGLVLREHRIVRELVALLRHALGVAPLNAAGVIDVLGGSAGGLDAVAVRRLRGALLIAERRESRAAGREPARTDELLLEGFAFPGERPLVDSAGGRALRRVGLVAAAGRRVHEAGGTARETLWAIWEATGLAGRWQEEALGALGARSDAANRSLDAVLGLFFRLQRHEEQGSEQPIAELLTEVLATGVPEDTLADRGAREEVTVTTPQGAIGREFALVCVFGPQDGVWPNLRAQGSLLGAAALERLLLGGEAVMPERRETLHDELRLFALACSRARDELLVLSVSDEDRHPGPFFGLGRDHETGETLPSSRLNLRGAVAEMRRRLAEHPDDAVARDSLVRLARESAPGAHPSEWYGVLPPSTEAPLVDLAGDPDALVPVSPSQLESAEQCPLSWAIDRLGGGTGGTAASLGTLLHHVFETARNSDPDELFALVEAEWGKLDFDAEWQNERELGIARDTVRRMGDYLTAFDVSGGELLAREAGFGVQVGRAMLRGMADRIELERRAGGLPMVSILDLKTGRKAPTASELAEHAQLQAYQLGLVLGGFDALGPDRGETEPDGDGAPSAEAVPFENGGARLLYVRPEAAKTRPYLEARQPPLSDEAREAFTARVIRIAEVMAGSSFTVRIEHHCTDEYSRGTCRLHIVPAVSRS